MEVQWRGWSTARTAHTQMHEDWTTHIQTVLGHQLGVLQLDSILTLYLEVVSDPTGERLSPIRLSSTSDANRWASLLPVLWLTDCTDQNSHEPLLRFNQFARAARSTRRNKSLTSLPVYYERMQPGDSQTERGKGQGVAMLSLSKLLFLILYLLTIQDTFGNAFSLIFTEASSRRHGSLNHWSWATDSTPSPFPLPRGQGVGLILSTF